MLEGLNISQPPLDIIIINEKRRSPKRVIQALMARKDSYTVSDTCEVFSHLFLIVAFLIMRFRNQYFGLL